MCYVSYCMNLDCDNCTMAERSLAIAGEVGIHSSITFVAQLILLLFDSVMRR